MQSSHSAYSTSTYRNIFKMENDEEIQYADQLIRALHTLNPQLAPFESTHPFSSLIAGGLAAAKDLIDLIETSIDQKRFDALDALAHIYLHGGAQLEDIARLKKLIKQEKDPHFIAAIAKCIAISGDENFLLEQMQKLSDEDPGVVAAAAVLLGFGAYEPALPALIALVSPSRFFESACVIWALGEIGSSAALPVLEHAAREGFRTCDCLIAMGKIGSLTSIPHLTPFILSGLPNQIEAAYHALSMILHRHQDTPTLLHILGDELMGLVKNQLQSADKTISIATRFYMVLCLARMGQKLEKNQLRRYLGIELDENETGQLASFFMKRESYKN